ncbi:1,4-alpha-glucan branching protein GlgB [Plastoroseomonas arctica]|uniref:1,4-alpha-glucan branching enzyme GlgB n=1 Tax=Plastoroseomonas arctica TaxID=1509237 RepID=A0AAF1JVI1_9PROT|nr:1,4-alpha-glucan branching protein GlgB [Plastoroseomonas arctica]MBR0654631.1 1,4-alpha-glucan branching protein GlgB [Plastoroseomonas arctica]
MSDDAAAIEALVHGRHGDPFAVLGWHGGTFRCLLPGAHAVSIRTGDGEPIALTLAHAAGLFTGEGRRGPSTLLDITWPDTSQQVEDAYSFGLLLSDEELRLFAEGRLVEAGRTLGAKAMRVDGVLGTRFALWAPNARRASVIGPFNGWDGRRNPMRRRGDSGVWEIFIPRLSAGMTYKYELLGADGALLPPKADPYAAATELPPGTASVIADAAPFSWTDAEWIAQRGARQSATAPISVYEVHAASWWRDDAGRSPDWDALGDRLIPYATGLGFTHLELMPIMEHPFGGSWGYQPLGQFAPSARFGTPYGFARFVDRAHAAGLGIILDWVPAHFPTDAHGLYRFDGTALYEHADPREGFHRDWNTAIFNLGRREVSGFLLASALHWIEHFHVDGLRVDAVASMLYRDYSREAGEWVPNIHGGRENLEAVDFLRTLNTTVAERCPGAIVVAEESTSWPGVTAPVAEGGLGFAFKWNMGWMHDTLRYMEEPSIYRRWHHHEMTFGLVYAWSEKFMLPLSHDEVVYGKHSLLEKMPGDRWQQLANLRAYFAFMWAHPGKKLLFMGGEIAQPREWNHDAAIAWNLLDDPAHRGVQAVVRDLNRAYRDHPALHRHDASAEGFRWVIGDASAECVFAFLRLGDDGEPPALVVSNFTPLPREGWRIGVPVAGQWREVINTDAAAYGGGNLGNTGSVRTDAIASHGEAQSLSLLLPPLATLILLPEPSP